MKFEDLRRKRDGCAKPTTADLVRKSSRIVTSARRAAERTLLNISFAAMTELSLHSLSCSKHSITDKHSEALASVR